MTTLADLAEGGTRSSWRAGGQRGPGHGMTSPIAVRIRSRRGSVLIGLDGSLSGMLGETANLIPVQSVHAFRCRVCGEVMTSGGGETMLMRGVRVEMDGTCRWSASVSGPVWHSTEQWPRIGQATLEEKGRPPCPRSPM